MHPQRPNVAPCIAPQGHPNILKLHAVAFAGPQGAETDGFMLLDFWWGRAQASTEGNGGHCTQSTAPCRVVGTWFPLNLWDLWLDL